MNELKDPSEVLAIYHKFAGQRDVLEREVIAIDSEIKTIDEFLKLEPKVLDALEKLDGELFKNITTLLENKLSVALQEILEQDIRLKVEPVIQGKSIGFKFRTIRNGFEEDIIKGNGGSVTNILSVCLRIFALTQLPEENHRRFLVLDEQDCWLQPELIPRFAKIIHEAAKALNFQVLIISHHNSEIFAQYADRIFRLEPSPSGVKVEILDKEPKELDQIIQNSEAANL
jgi:DNA repair exonuclease SbcCD ATPase subunit